ncbi:phytoene synthase [Amphibacillus marinus]|uniref:Phytoene synthase n=1 Tax=Amphibacillus marinus TaxID=872970 RepID=A0A1H8K2L3_9BACI|nr:phytoene/squalene synthase family protein [Amphibacillus marinus]SEN87182.1 phytoene synthase [Amphibacillus marinus]
MLDRDLAQACKIMMKQGSSSFYHAFKYLPRQEREAVYVIYSFCRLIDDAVDEPEASPYSLQELEQHFSHLKQAKGHFIWPSLRWVMETYNLNKAPYYLQMSGQRLDYAQQKYATVAQLEDYCYRVAGSVGEMIVPILHPAPGQSVVESGIALGKAMQIVNIIRDIGADQKLGRRYIPLEIMQLYGYTEHDWENQIINDPFCRVIQHLINQADKWFEIGLAFISSYPTKSALTLRLAATYYREIIEVVKENKFQVFERRAIVTNQRKNKLLLQLTKF